MKEIERAKVNSAKRMIEQDGLDKARRLCEEGKRDPLALQRALEQLAQNIRVARKVGNL